MTPNQHLASLVVPERLDPMSQTDVGFNECRRQVLSRIDALTPVVLYGYKHDGDWEFNNGTPYGEPVPGVHTHRLLTFQELLTPIAPKDERVSVEEVTKMREDIHVHGINHINALDMCNLLRRIERHGIKTEVKP